MIGGCMGIVNIGSESDDWRAVACSNFTHFVFFLDNQFFLSTEGFIQGIMWPEGHINRYMAFSCIGKEAKKFGKEAERKFVWWQGKEILFGSPEHHALIVRAMRAKFGQNQTAMEALLATGDDEITHDLGKPESPNTSFPAKLFCETLMKIRSESRD